MEWNNVFIVIKNGQWVAHSSETGRFIKCLNKDERLVAQISGCVKYEVIIGGKK